MHDFKVEGKNLFCTGFAWNVRRNFVYVGCWDMSATRATPGSLQISTYDVVKMEVVSTINVPQTAEAVVESRLRMVIVTGSTPEDVHLLTYDQGPSRQTESFSPPKVRVFRKVVEGELEFLQVVGFSFPSDEF